MNIRERVEECVKIKEVECQSFQKLFITGGVKYFVVYKDGKIDQNDFIPVFDDNNVELVFIFLRLYPVNGRGGYYTYLSPIIVFQNLIAIEKIMTINDWSFDFECQSLFIGGHVTQVKICNSSLGFFKEQAFSVNKFSNLYRFLNKLSECKSKAEAIFLFDLYKKDEKIDDLEKSISRLGAELHIKNLQIESYIHLLESIKKLF